MPQNSRTLLGIAYDSDEVLRDCILDACSKEPFYNQLQRGDLPSDPEALRTRLQNCIRIHETTNPTSTNSLAGTLSLPG